MRALVTGVSGFVGTNLKNQLLSNNWNVTGYDHRKIDQNTNVIIGDIQDPITTKNAILQSQPDVVFHLAGVLKSTTIKDYYSTHVLGTLTLFESLLETGCKPRVIIASSSAVYGSGYGKHPISEKFALRPMTDYAISKVAQEMIARRFFLAYQIPTVIFRTFNLIGAGQSPELACSSFARQIAINEISNDFSPIKTGNLSAKRDFIDIRDATRAYELLAQGGPVGGIFNVCSGQPTSIQTCLNILLGMTEKKLAVEIDRSKIQSNDVPIQVGSTKLIEKTTGWSPKISLQDSLKDLLDDWRKKVKAG